MIIGLEDILFLQQTPNWQEENNSNFCNTRLAVFLMRFVRIFYSSRAINIDIGPPKFAIDPPRYHWDWETSGSRLGSNESVYVNEIGAQQTHTLFGVLW
jgi:hypothetical protein